MMKVTAHALQEIHGKNDWRDGSSNVSWKQILTMPTWRSAAEWSTVEKQRPKSSIAYGWKTGASDESDDVEAERTRW